jgi:hypothetical protein
MNSTPIFFEEVNKDIAFKLANLSFENFLNFYDTPEIDENNEELDQRIQYNLLKDYCFQHIKNKFQPLKREYSYSKNNNNGRLFVSDKLGLQRIWAKFRGVLCDDIYLDFDMINCHPTILLYLCKTHNIECYTLNTYINNREDKLMDLINNECISRGDAKKLFIISMNSNFHITKYNKKIIKDTFFINFDKEIKKIQQSLLSLYPDIKKQLIRRGKTTNLEGCLLNSLLCNVENEILQKSIKELENNNIIVEVPMFDGFMVKNNNSIIIDDVIDILNKCSFEYGIKWSNKEHDISILDDLNELSNDNNYLSFIGVDVVEISKYLINTLLKDKILKCYGQYFYLNNKLWINNEKEIKILLKKLISNLDLWIQTDKPYKISKCKKGVDELIDFILAHTPENNKFNTELWEKTQYKLFFNNGYYDFINDKFNKTNDLSTKILIENDLNIKSNKSVRKDIYNKILYPLFGVDDLNKDKDNKQYLDYFLYKLSRAVAGHIEDKNWILMKGQRNSGKGVIGDLLKNCFGKYIKTTNSGNFTLKNYSNNDEAKSNSWILDYEFCRIAITNEIKIDNDNKNKVDGNIIKKFCSGGDYMEARKNYQDEIEFRIQSTLLICCNDIPEMSPTDAYEFTTFINMTSAFKEIDDKYKMKNIKYYKPDNSIKTHFIKKKDVINEFILILIDAYKNKVDMPEKFKMEVEENKEDDDLNIILDTFKFTNNDNDFISNNDLKTYYKDLRLPMSFTKFKGTLKGFGAEDGRNSKERGLKFIKEID